MSFSYSPNTVNDNSLVFYLDANNPKCGSVGATRIFNLGRPTLPSGSESSIFQYLDSQGGTTIITSSYGNLFEFDGTDDYWKAVNSPIKSLPGNFTYSTWVNHDRNFSNPQGAVIYLGADGSSEERAWMRIAGNQIELVISNGVITSPRSSTYPLYTTASYPNPFNHITVTGINNGNNTTTTTFYINGLQVTSSLINISQSRSSSINLNINEPDIGRAGSSGGYRFSGEISMVQIYTRTLSANEVARNYNTTKTRFGL